MGISWYRYFHILKVSMKKERAKVKIAAPGKVCETAELDDKIE
jgi:hypothetical protein